MQSNSLTSQFLLNPEITFLNFGSFGSCPKPVFEDYQKWQRELEYEPVQFMAVNGPAYLKRSREALGAYVGCDADDLVYVTNPSYAVNIIAKSLELKEGDEVLTTGLEYGACDKTWEYYCKKKGARYVRQEITLPIVSKEQFVADFFKGLSSKTKLVFISHITSSTGLILPVKEICKTAREKGLMTFIDGAHTAGQLPLNLAELGADIYTGACHKWMMTAKGCSFLYVKKALQPLFDPLIVSWGYNSAAPSSSRFIDYHQGQGTRDFSAFLTVPKAIEFMKEHNWWQVAANCRRLVQENAGRFCKLLGSSPLAPVTDEFIAQLFSIPITTDQPEALQRLLFEKYKVEIPVMRHGDRVFLRYSVNAFNSQKDLDTLYNAVSDIISTTGLIHVKSADSVSSSNV
jgi:isopenicillin-N epimerase